MALPRRNTAEIISELTRKRIAAKDPKTLQARAELQSLDAIEGSDERYSGQDRERRLRVIRCSAERTPRIRVCVPMAHEHYTPGMWRALARQRVSYERIPIRADNEAWYFLDELEHLRILVRELPPKVFDVAPPARGRWAQRVKVPYAIDHYELCIKDYLLVRGVRAAHSASETEGISWYLLDGISDVKILLDALDACSAV